MIFRKAFIFNILAIFFISNFSLFAQKKESKSFNILQPQTKRDTLLPIFNKGDVFSYKVKNEKTTFEDDEKMGTQTSDFSIGLEVKNVDKNQVQLAFILTKSQLFSRTFGAYFPSQSVDNQPVEIDFSIEKKTKIVEIQNYETISKILLSELDVLAKKDARISETLFSNQIEKLKFDLKNGDSKLMATSFLDLVFFLEAYNFPITNLPTSHFYRSDYEYFAASRACILDCKQVSTKKYFNLHYDKSQDTKQKSAKDVTLDDFDFRYSVLFDAKFFPQSVGLFLLKKTGKKKIIETWTLSQ
jgi:hypothetical protein